MSGRCVSYDAYDDIAIVKVRPLFYLTKLIRMDRYHHYAFKVTDSGFVYKPDRSNMKVFIGVLIYLYVLTAIICLASGAAQEYGIWTIVEIFALITLIVALMVGSMFLVEHMEANMAKDYLALNYDFSIMDEEPRGIRRLME